MTAPVTAPALRDDVALRTSGRFAALLSPLALAVVGIAIGWWVPKQFGAQWTSTWTSTVVFSITAATVGFLYSRLGMASLAQVALVGVGGWLTLRITFASSLPFLVVLPIAASATAVIGGALSVPALRLRGLYLALVTVMMAAGFDIVINATGFPNGGPGLLGYQASGDLARMRRPSFATTDGAYFRFALFVAVALFLLIWLHDRTSPGRAWKLIAKSEGAAAASGINIARYTTWAFMLGAFVSGAAGALFAGQLGQLGPSSFQTIDSLILFAFVLVAGANQWWGWVLGAVLYRALPQLLDDRGISGDIAIMIAGAALMLNLIAAPDGVAGEVTRRVDELRIRRGDRGAS